MAGGDTKDPHPVDVHVGLAIRTRRRAIGMNQHELAARLGVTYQQVQKYERSGNRISASRLFDVARVLGVPVAYFFSGMSDAEAEVFTAEIDNKVSRMMQLDEGVEMIEAFPLLKDGLVRRNIVDLVKSLGRSAGA